VARLFGTDGVRGVANAGLTPELALSLAAAAVAELVHDTRERPHAVVGRDPRPSGELLESAVVAGLLAAGADVTVLGVVPTPAVAHAVAAGVPGRPSPALGVMISASHNPMPDNGVKFFGAGGFKLPDAVEDRIAGRISEQPARPTGADVGRRLPDLGNGAAWYVDHLVATLTHPLDGLRVVVDCANGAAATVGPTAYRKAGADVVVINDDTSGYRINDACGATHVEGLQAAVREHRADAGIAHDGDADRCIAVDADGRTVDGDQILAVLALALRDRSALRGNTVAATVMSNLGFHKAMAEHDITVAETGVGDRYVLERMVADRLSLGGEQSGHVILLDHATTGDGLLTGLQLLSRVAQTGRPLAELAAVMTRLPQVLVNVPVEDKAAAIQALTPLAEQATAELRGDGRVLVRPSGTEPLVRVMVEASSEQRAREVAERLAASVG
jgi:phosphoglucosamine mutase